MNLRLYYPVKPLSLNQGFGSNPAYYARFKDSFGNPLKGHNGLDFQASHGTPVYASCDGLIHFDVDTHGGEGMVIHTDFCEYNEQTVTFNVIHWHLIGNTDPNFPSPIPTDGIAYPVEAGALIGYADNTGAPFESSGDHLHFGLFPLDLSGVILDQKNGFDGRIDPTPFFTKIYASDVAMEISLLQQLISTLKRLVGLLPPKTQ